ncbi:non-ribosomal peptide synthetase, partial [Streptomyces sp. CBMA123]|uniref:non-ribosomal peptide synthetase n=1 Tax=Streptomyces sp. CBMA123 TaxID=1896313 RepID=UPI001661D72B
VEQPAGHWTYGQLAERAHRLAHRLRSAGVAAGDVVALYGPRGAELACAMLGTLAAGAAFLVLDTAEPAARLAEQLTLAAPRALVRTDGAEVPAELLARTGAAPVLPCRDDLTEQPVGVPQFIPGPDSPAYLAFTSGSTGRPKAVLGTHGPLAHFTAWYRDEYGLTAEDRFALLSAPGHDPMLRDVLVPLALGATVCVPDHATLPGRFADWAEAQRITVANLTPATLEYLLAGRPAARTAPALRHLFFGGDRLRGHHVTLARSLNPDVTCVNFYGATETPQAMSAHRVPAGEPAAEIPLGSGTPGSQLILLNPAGAPAGVGEPAEIHVRSPHLSAGYPADAALTAARFHTSPVTGDPADRWFRTGDLGRYLPDGTVRFCGRADRQIQIRGFRVEPAEVEARLREHPGVADCVVGLQGADGGDAVDGADAGGPRLVAHWTPATTAAPTARELREHTGAVLPDHLVPAAFVRLDALPLLPTGKVDVSALPAAPAAERDADEPYAAPVTEVEKALAAIWEDVLGVERVGLNDDFFALGGHSLLATVVTHRVREALGTEIAVRALFEDRTVAGLAKLVEQQGDAVGAGAPGPIRSVARTEAGLDDLLARLGALTDGEG